MAVTSFSSSSATLLKTLQSPTDLFSRQFSPITILPKPLPSSPKPKIISTHSVYHPNKPFSDNPASWKWRTGVSFFPAFSTKGKDSKNLKEQLFEAIAPLDRGAEATPQDQERVDRIACKLEAVNKIKEPLKSNLLNGKWELLYTTSQSVLQTKRPKFLRPNGKIYQAINVDTLRAQNMETWPFFNQVTANLVPLNARRVAVKFDFFKIAGLIPIKNPGSGRGQLEITYLDEELRISRGDKGNLFILKMVEPSYRVPL
ncbi:hypothetical protein L1049_015671 [Liquidambar formosana]|uniref:Plastid lipid-associated protein/fibrillin conserved domain-containing protein n=1 Tax=Liquidambar formosana TaxID=63359 RepID=A0AAP0X697_LIQFO